MLGGDKAIDNHVSVIQVPNNIVRNQNLSSLGFVLYLYLLYLFRGKTISIATNTIMKNIGFFSQRQLKKCFSELNNLQLIKEYYNTLPKFQSLKLTPLKLVNNTYFTQLPSVLFTQWLKIIDSKGVRLLYYYESLINRKGNIDYARPSLETISLNTGLSKPTIIKYNNLLVKHKLLDIKEQPIGTFSTDCGLEYMRFNNHYYVLVDNFFKIEG